MPPAVPSADVETIDDETLLRRYAERRDPAAFAELAHRRAGLVFGVCLRITADRHDAEELTQDCLLQLARKAATIQTSVAGWLHQVATHRALNAVRSRGRRRAREAHAAAVETETTETAWREVEPLLDEAVDGLPADVREAIILHFLQSLSQETVAQRLGVHQSTVSRRIDRGLHLLRERLLASGVAMSAAPLSALLAAAASTPGAPNLAEAIGKIALAGAGSGGAGGLFGWLGLSWANVKAWVSLIGAAALPIIVQLLAGGWFGFLLVVLMTLYLVRRRPAWLVDLWAAPGGSGSDNPFDPYRRWTWTTPPQNWRTRLSATVMMGLTMGGMSLTMMLADPPSPGLAAVFVFYAVIALSTAARIVIRVVRFRNNEYREPPAESAEPPADAVGVVQKLCFVPISPLMLTCITVANIRMGQSSAYTLGFFSIFTILSIWGIADSIRSLSRYRRLRRASLGAEDRSAAPAPPAKGTVGVLAYLLLTTVVFTMSALFSSLPALGATSGYAAIKGAEMGYTSPLSLMFLSVAIRPFARLRGTSYRRLWRFAVAVAALCAVLNLVLCVVFLMPRT